MCTCLVKWLPLSLFLSLPLSVCVDFVRDLIVQRRTIWYLHKINRCPTCSDAKQSDSSASTPATASASASASKIVSCCAMLRGISTYVFTCIHIYHGWVHVCVVYHTSIITYHFIVRLDTQLRFPLFFWLILDSEFVLQLIFDAFWHFLFNEKIYIIKIYTSSSIYIVLFL